jgi:hypothetical protein
MFLPLSRSFHPISLSICFRQFPGRSFRIQQALHLLVKSVRLYVWFHKTFFFHQWRRREGRRKTGDGHLFMDSAAGLFFLL